MRKGKERRKVKEEDSYSFRGLLFYVMYIGAQEFMVFSSCEDDEITEQESYSAFYATGALFWYHCAAVKYGEMEERGRRKGKETIKNGSMKGNLVKDERERLRNFDGALAILMEQ